MVHIQGGTHEEMLHPEMSIVDRTPGFLAEARVGSSMIKTKFVEVKEPELMYGEAKFPGDVSPVDGGINDFWGFLLFSSSGRGHGVVIKYQREWARL